MATKLDELRQKRAELAAKAKKIREAVQALGDDADDDKVAEYGAALSEVTKAFSEVENRINLEEQSLRAQEIEERVGGPRTRETAEDRSNPWSCLGEQLCAIAAVGMGREADPRLYQAAATGASATVGADGGFLIRRDFTTRLMETGMAQAVLAPRCDEIPIGAGSHGLEAPYIPHHDRTTGNRFGGVRVYRKSEAATVTDSKPGFEKFQLDLEDLMALAYATERSLQDATQLQAVFETAFREEFAFVIDDEILNGTGVGQCLGIMNSDVKSAVAKEGSQAADTVLAANVVKMFARCFRPLQAAWFVNQQVFEQLPLMTLGDRPVFIPGVNVAGAPYGTLFGRPIFPIEQAAALGDEGDIMLLNLNQYALITKGGIQADQSIHVRFIYNERAFRWVMRINGAPKWRTSQTPAKANSGFKITPFVTLAARA